MHDLSERSHAAIHLARSLVGKRLAFAAAAAILLCLAPGAAKAAEESRPEPTMIPMTEVGLILPVTYRESYPGFGKDSEASAGLGFRIDVSAIGSILRAVEDQWSFRAGDYLGLDLAITNRLISARLVYGLQASYELTRNLGAGFRVYWMIIIDDVMKKVTSGSLHDNYPVGEISARYKTVIGRVRFSLAETDTGTRGHALGASLRFPFPGKPLDYDGLAFGLDYDRLTLRANSGVNDAGGGTGYQDVLVHRVTAVVALAY